MVIKSSASEPTKRPKGCGISSLHPEADVVLLIDDEEGSGERRRLRVSTAVLKTASSYFRKLFGPNFQEGKSIKDGANAEIVLKDDHPEAMELMLSALHSRHTRRLKTLKPLVLAHVALLADKYLCLEALGDRTAVWLHNSKVQGHDQVGYGHLITAAYYFQSSKYFEKATAAVIPHFTSDWVQDGPSDMDVTNWSTDRAIKHLPRRVIGMSNMICLSTST